MLPYYRDYCYHRIVHTLDHLEGHKYRVTGSQAKNVKCLGEKLPLGTGMRDINKPRRNPVLHENRTLSTTG